MRSVVRDCFFLPVVQSWRIFGGVQDFAAVNCPGSLGNGGVDILKINKSYIHLGSFILKNSL